MRLIKVTTLWVALFSIILYDTPHLRIHSCFTKTKWLSLKTCFYMAGPQHHNRKTHYSKHGPHGDVVSQMGVGVGADCRVQTYARRYRMPQQLVGPCRHHFKSLSGHYSNMDQITFYLFHWSIMFVYLMYCLFFCYCCLVSLNWLRLIQINRERKTS